jgi:hypothetical protein
MRASIWCRKDCICLPTPRRLGIARQGQHDAPAASKASNLVETQATRPGLEVMVPKYQPTSFWKAFDCLLQRFVVPEIADEPDAGK